ncbi:MAG: BrnT family toxin [Planctomycetes bacterium]|nr:BrnT family toxin [Planctomycetota bacterium]
MEQLRFAWDPGKASANVRKHGVSFEEAETVFADDNALLIDDPDHSLDEERAVLLGVSVRLRIIVVCHTLRDKGRTIRLISARRATRSERDQYVEQLNP